MILLDCREGDPDRTGQAATFEGFFDFETGELRRGLSDADRAEVEESKRLLRGLMRDSRRSTRIPR
ncbi:MAG: hypothetical protein E6I19_13755 [Chloroflexi bacterium]|nr:MAG: hypothetical protein E6I19_13755 [Chloroflexota bacterium]